MFVWTCPRVGFWLARIRERKGREGKGREGGAPARPAHIAPNMVVEWGKDSVLVGVIGGGLRWMFGRLCYAPLVGLTRTGHTSYASDNMCLGVPVSIPGYIHFPGWLDPPFVSCLRRKTKRIET